MLASRPAHERGGKGDRAFLAFKLHRFISGAGHVYATLRSSGQRRVTLDGQRFDPEDQTARLFATFFCRNCGQEYHPVVLTVEDGAHRVLPRDIDDTPLDDPDSAERPGYLMPEPENDSDFTFNGELEDFPEDWLELDRGGAPRLRRDRKKYVPEPLTVDATGIVGSTGRRAWFLPGKFRFCPACKHQPAGQAREINKLAALSAEGRSSATTLLVSSAIRWMWIYKQSAPARFFRWIIAGLTNRVLPTEPAQRIITPLMSLERIMDDHGIQVVNDLKLDCEGSEFEVLRNISSACWSRIERAAIEHHEFGRDRRIAELAKILEDNGFEVEVNRSLVDKLGRPFGASTGEIWAWKPLVATESATLLIKQTHFP
jgi:hypothetical protein